MGESIQLEWQRKNKDLDLSLTLAERRLDSLEERLGYLVTETNQLYRDVTAKSQNLN